MAHNSIISLPPIFAQNPPEHLAFTQGPLQASAPAELTFHASCTQGNAGLPALCVQFSLIEPSKEGSQQAWHARLQPDPLGFTCSDPSPRSRILEPEPPVTWG